MKIPVISLPKDETFSIFLKAAWCAAALAMGVLLWASWSGLDQPAGGLALLWLEDATGWQSILSSF